MRRVVSGLLVGLLFGPGTATTAGQTSFVPFCSVVANPAHYDQKVILTAGIVVSGPESSSFFDSDCPPTPEHDLMTLPVPIRDRAQESRGWKQMSRLLAQKNTAFVVVRGVFDAFGRYSGPIPSDPRLREILEKGSSRFGHLGVARFRLRIEQVEFVAPASD